MNDESERSVFQEIERLEERIKHRLKEAERAAEDKISEARKDAVNIISEKEKKLQETRLLIDTMIKKKKMADFSLPAPAADITSDVEQKLDKLAKTLLSQIINETSEQTK